MNTFVYMHVVVSMCSPCIPSINITSTSTITITSLAPVPLPPVPYTHILWGDHAQKDTQTNSMRTLNFSL